MAVTAKMYTKYNLSAAQGIVDLDNGLIHCALYPASASGQPHLIQASGSTYSSTGELNGINGYTQGGVSCGSGILSTNATQFIFDVNIDPTWNVTNSGFTYRYAVFYNNQGTKPLISYVDFGADVVASAGTHTIVVNSNGIGRITVS